MALQWGYQPYQRCVETSPVDAKLVNKNDQAGCIANRKGGYPAVQVIRYDMFVDIST